MFAICKWWIGTGKTCYQKNKTTLLHKGALPALKNQTVVFQLYKLLGKFLRESGHSLAPLPPAKMITFILLRVFPLSSLFS